MDELPERSRVLYAALHLRARDAASARPVLDDRDAVALADATGHDYSRFRRVPAVFAVVHAARAACLDRVVRGFVATHPDAVVLDLGCGLDTRVRRCAPPPGVDWYDVDLPEVVALRERLLPGVSHALAADLTGTGWPAGLAGLPGDRPVIAVADGLMAVLPGPAFRATVAAVAGHFRSGEIAFNAYTRAALRRGGGPEALRLPGEGEGIDDAHEPEGWAPGLRLVEELRMGSQPEVERFPQPWRTITRLGARSERVSRAADRVVRYAFGRATAAGGPA